MIKVNSTLILSWIRRSWWVINYFVFCYLLQWWLIFLLTSLTIPQVRKLFRLFSTTLGFRNLSSCWLFVWTFVLFFWECPNLASHKLKFMSTVMVKLSLEGSQYSKVDLFKEHKLKLVRKEKYLWKQVRIPTIIEKKLSN